MKLEKLGSYALLLLIVLGSLVVFAITYTPEYFGIVVRDTIGNSINAILMYILVSITIWYAYNTNKQVKLIEKERKAKLISSTVKPEIERLLTSLHGKLSLLKLKSGEFYFKISYSDEKGKVKLVLHLKLNKIKIKTWIFDYTILKEYKRSLKTIEEINQKIEEMKELMEKMVEAFSEQIHLFDSKTNELIKIGGVKPKANSDIDKYYFNKKVRKALIECVMLKIIDDTAFKVKSIYDRNYNSDFNVDIETFSSIVDEIVKELYIKWDVVRLKKVKNELIELIAALKWDFEKLLQYWRKEYDIIEYRNKTELDIIKV